MLTNKLHDSPLGKANIYIDKYEASLLFPISREEQRKKLQIDLQNLPFQGEDFWTAFEISWLNLNGKPEVAIGEFSFPHNSTHLIESKSFKLYLNSFNNSKFESLAEVEKIIAKDLSVAVCAVVMVKLTLVTQAPQLPLTQFTGTCLDELNVCCDDYEINSDLLKVEDTIVTETVYSNLLKSNCPVTGQPDWASLQITYSGKQINHASLLKYIVSYRNHNGFHEDCVERIFTDINRIAQPQRLFVYARYTRRGGLDINPYRANYPIKIENIRLHRQ